MFLNFIDKSKRTCCFWNWIIWGKWIYLLLDWVYWWEVGLSALSRTKNWFKADENWEIWNEIIWLRNLFFWKIINQIPIHVKQILQVTMSSNPKFLFTNVKEVFQIQRFIIVSYGDSLYWTWFCSCSIEVNLVNESFFSFLS